MTFPEGYPEHAPLAKAAAAPEFKKGTEIDVHGVKVIVMTDNRLPLVSWNLAMRRGSHSVAVYTKRRGPLVAWPQAARSSCVEVARMRLPAAPSEEHPGQARRDRVRARRWGLVSEMSRFCFRGEWRYSAPHYDQG